MFVFSDNLNYNGKLKKRVGLKTGQLLGNREDCEQEGRNIKCVDRETIKRTKYV